MGDPKMNYEALDAQIIAKVAEGANRFDRICVPLEERADFFAGKGKGWRLIDRRLQALKKSGRLAYEGKSGWMVA